MLGARGWGLAERWPLHHSAGSEAEIPGPLAMIWVTEVELQRSVSTV